MTGQSLKKRDDSFCEAVGSGDGAFAERLTLLLGRDWMVEFLLPPIRGAIVSLLYRYIIQLLLLQYNGDGVCWWLQKEPML